MQCCLQQPFKSGLCRACYRQRRASEYHCTWHNCLRPVFALTLCRTHYRRIHVECAWDTCHRPVYCRQVCAHHYRKRAFPTVDTCTLCDRQTYMDGKCFYHFTHRTCRKCERIVFSKQLCQRHYMREYRHQRRRVEIKGPTTNSDIKPEKTSPTPDAKSHIPDTQSSFEQVTTIPSTTTT